MANPKKTGAQRMWQLEALARDRALTAKEKKQLKRIYDRLKVGWMNRISTNPAWIPARAVRVLRDRRGNAKAIQLRVSRATRENLQGYEDRKFRFHPIRGSEGYDPSLVGEGGRRVARRATKRKKRRKVARRATR